MIACPLSGYHHDSLARADRKAGRERTLEAFLDARRHREKLRLLRRIQSAAGTAARDCEVIVGVKSDAARGAPLRERIEQRGDAGVLAADRDDAHCDLPPELGSGLAGLQYHSA
eukprot:COSAG06_NODE_9907_length_1791_cov_1.871825_2_plen_114_part_00